jgi:signal peptide peptidase-like protein 3
MDGNKNKESIIDFYFIVFYLVIATGLCISFIALVRLPNLKVSALLLLGLVIYDVFWVYFSHYIFTTNVMVKVATREAENPVK